MKVRKKPVVVDAVQYKGELPIDREFSTMDYKYDGGDLWIFNYLENCFVRCPKGHWIVKGVKREFYPVEHDAFTSTYEPVAEEDVL